MEDKYIEKIATIESITKENNKKINELEKTYILIEKMDCKIINLESSLNRIEQKVLNIDNKKINKWERFIDYIFYSVIAYALVKLGLK